MSHLGFIYLLFFNRLLQISFPFLKTKTWMNLITALLNEIQVN